MSSAKLVYPPQGGCHHGDKSRIYGAFDAFAEY